MGRMNENHFPHPHSRGSTYGDADSYRTKTNPNCWTLSSGIIWRSKGFHLAQCFSEEGPRPRDPKLQIFAACCRRSSGKSKLSRYSRQGKEERLPCGTSVRQNHRLWAEETYDSSGLAVERYFLRSICRMHQSCNHMAISMYKQIRDCTLCCLNHRIVIIAFYSLSKCGN